MITQERLKEIFDYHLDGHLVWRVVTKKSRHVRSGSLLGCDTPNYRRCTFDGKNHLVHRLIFLYHHGYMPQYVDHIDCNKQNNRIENLRPATFRENCSNIGLTKKNTSGLKGITWDKKRERWVAQIGINYKNKYLGRYKTKEDAHEAYCQAAKRLHGEFARFE